MQLRPAPFPSHNKARGSVRIGQQVTELFNGQEIGPMANQNLMEWRGGISAVCQFNLRRISQAG